MDTMLMTRRALLLDQNELEKLICTLQLALEDTNPQVDKDYIKYVIGKLEEVESLQP